MLCHRASEYQWLVSWIEMTFRFCRTSISLIEMAEYWCARVWTVSVYGVAHLRLSMLLRRSESTDGIKPFHLNKTKKFYCGRSVWNFKQAHDIPQNEIVNSPGWFGSIHGFAGVCVHVVFSQIEISTLLSTTFCFDNVDGIFNIFCKELWEWERKWIKAHLTKSAPTFLAIDKQLIKQ